MKKLIAILLVLAALMGVCSAAFTDEKEITDTYAEAVNAMVEAKVISGFPDGTFQPKGTLTRAQAAKIITVLLEGDKAETVTAAAAGFVDVPAGNWAEKYVNYCAEKGIVAGVGNGKFDPNGQLKGSQWAKMLLVAYGHDAAELTARGTWDNALTNAAVVELMLSGRLPQNVVVAFTGDEEVKSRGAQEVVGALSEADCYVRFVVVTDVTNVGWEHGLAFTIENDLNVDILTAHSIVEGMKGYAGRYGFVHEALPDESWIYDEYKLPCLTLCHPVGGDMHSDEGALARLSAFPVYCDALADLCKILAELIH